MPRIPVGPCPPNLLPGLQLWLRADQIVGIVNGGNIAAWPDLSPNNVPVAQNTPASQPTFTAVNAAMNNQPSAHFSGTPTFLSLSGIGLALLNSAPSLTIVTVVSSAVGGQVWLSLGSGTGGARINDGRITATRQLTGRRLDADSLQTLNGNAYSDTLPHICLTSVDYRTAYAEVRLDGLSGGIAPNAFSTPGNSSPVNAQVSTVGANQGVTQALTGDISEIAVFVPQLSRKAVEALEYYLSQRYALAGPAITPT